MSIAITIMCDDRAHDVRVPADVPVATLEPDLERLTGRAPIALVSALGVGLDRDATLRSNGVRDGAVLQVDDPAPGPAVYDDPVELIPRPPAARRGSGVPPAVLAVALAGAVWLAGRPGLAHLTEALAVLGIVAGGVGPRLGLRVARLHAQEPAEVAGAARRAALAARVAATATRVAVAGTVLAGSALAARDDRWAVLAGWGCLSLVAARASGRDGGLELLTASGGCLALARGLHQGHLAPATAGAALLLAMSWAARPAGHSPARLSPGPAARLAAERLGTLLTACVPALVVLASGLLPGAR